MSGTAVVAYDPLRNKAYQQTTTRRCRTCKNAKQRVLNARNRGHLAIIEGRG